MIALVFWHGAGGEQNYFGQVDGEVVGLVEHELSEPGALHESSPDLPVNPSFCFRVCHASEYSSVNTPPQRQGSVT